MADNTYVPSARSVSQILEDLKKEKQQAKQQSNAMTNKIKNFFTSTAKKTGAKAANKVTDIVSDAAVKGAETAVFGTSFSGMNPKNGLIKTAIGIASIAGGGKVISEFFKDDKTEEKSEEKAVSDESKAEEKTEEKAEEKSEDKEDKIYVPDESNLDAQAGIAGSNIKKGRSTKIMPFTEKQLKKMDHDQLGRINPRRVFVGNNNSPTLFDYSKQALANMYGPFANISAPVKAAGKILQAANTGFVDFGDRLADAFEQSPSFEEYAAEYQESPETEAAPAAPEASEKSAEDKTAERIAMAEDIAPSAESSVEADFSFGR